MRKITKETATAFFDLLELNESMMAEQAAMQVTLDVFELDHGDLFDLLIARESN